MIEVRTYEGDAEELTAFTSKVWQASYHGRMFVPAWNADYFDWQLLARRNTNGNYLVGAYDGTRLVGCLMAEEFRFRLRETEFKATMGSWMSVDPEYRRRGIAGKLFEEQRRRHLERDSRFCLGFLYTESRLSEGPRFWDAFPQDTTVLGKTTMWARPLDHGAVADWDPSWLRGAAARFAGPLFVPRPSRPRDDSGVRPYLASDLPACLELVRAMTDHVDLTYVWDAERLAHQLSYRNVPMTLVQERNGKLTGLLNYYALDFVERHPLPVAVIDVLAFSTEASAADKRQLLQAALFRMLEGGQKLALILKLPCYPAMPLLTTGFVPQVTSFDMLCIHMDASFPVEDAEKMFVHFR